MTPEDLAQAKDPDLRHSLAAMKRAAAMARQIAIQTGTELITYEDGKIVRRTAEALLAESRVEQATSPRYKR